MVIFTKVIKQKVIQILPRKKGVEIRVYMCPSKDIAMEVASRRHIEAVGTLLIARNGGLL